MMYQIDLEYDEWRLQAMVSLLAQVVKEPFFDKLRTKEQLGYLVWSGSSEMWGVLGVRFILQSDKATVEYLQQRILTFVRNYRTTLASMEKDKFEKNREALIALKLQKPKKLGEETHRYWSQITKRTYVFDHRELEVAELRKITLEDLVAFYDKFMMESGSEWRVLCSRTTGNCSKVTLRAESEKDKEDDSGETKNINSVDIKDFEAFKHSMPLYPVRAYLKSKSAAASAKL
jgi:insulysin